MLFDIDDTLVISDATICVTDSDGEKKYFTTAQFRDAKNSNLLENKEIDFHTFGKNTLSEIRDGRPGPGFDILERVLKEPYVDEIDFGLLTARSQYSEGMEGLKQFFTKHNTDFCFTEALCFFIHSPSWKNVLGGSSERKLKVLQALVESKAYKDIIFVDDDPAHEAAIKKSSIANDISFILV